MTIRYPVVLETEANGVVSAYVPGLPVYAAADTGEGRTRHLGRADGLSGGAPSGRAADEGLRRGFC
jgi:hypothetical protein